MDAAVAALLGAGIGAVTSIAGVWLQQWYQADRHLVAEAVKIGLAEFESDCAYAAKQKGVFLIPPPASYVAFNAQVLRAIASKSLTSEKLEGIRAERDALFNVKDDADA